MWRRLEHAGEALRPRTRCTPQCDTKACATLLPMCHHFHDVSCKSGSKIDVRARVSGIMEHAYFEALARDEGCDYCAGRRQVARLAPDLAAIYCISLQEQPHRTAKAAAQFHVLGLCRDVLFYRPVRGCDTDRAIWDSHRAVAADAIAKGFARILVLEDDVLFAAPGNAGAAHHGRAVRPATNLVGTLSRPCADPSLFPAAEPLAGALGLHTRLYRQRAPARLARLHCANEPASADVALDRAVD